MIDLLETIKIYPTSRFSIVLWSYLDFTFSSQDAFSPKPPNTITTKIP